MKKNNKERLVALLKKSTKWWNFYRDISRYGDVNINLSYADLESVELRGANLSNTNLRNTNLSNTDLRNTKLIYTNLSNANLRDANLRNADLRNANLRNAKLSNTKLIGADLSGAIGLFDSKKWFNNSFKKTNSGYIVYKAIGDTTYPVRNDWVISAGSYITENVNTNKTNDCGCGVNFGTMEYVKKRYGYSEIWECLLEFEDLIGLVVPYNTDGKCRCERLKLLKIIN